MTIVYNNAYKYFELLDAHNHVLAQSVSKADLLDIKLTHSEQ